MILAIRTDKPEAELYLLQDGKITEEIKWQAHRELANTILKKIDEILRVKKAEYKDILGIVVYTGSGSFTGLRIGTTVANTIAYGLEVPIVSTSENDWIEKGVELLKNRKAGNYVSPRYDSEPNITKPKS